MSEKAILWEEYRPTTHEERARRFRDAASAIREWQALDEWAPQLVSANDLTREALRIERKSRGAR